MDAVKRFSLTLMAALVVAGTTPAFSQTRDTRPIEPARSSVESGGGSSESAPADEPRWRQSTAGSTKNSPSEDGSALPDGPIPDLPTGEDDPDGGLIPQGFADVVNQPSFTCQIWAKRDGVWVYFTNTTGESLPPGTKVSVRMSDGSTLEYTLQATYVPGGKFGVKLDEMPKDWDCSPEVTLP